MPRRFPASETLPASCLRLLALLFQARVEGRPPPTVRELAAALGHRTHKPVGEGLRRLRDHGLVEWEPRRARTIRLRCRFDHS